MIAYCKTCKQDTIVKEKVGAACSWCDTVLVRECRSCRGPVYPKPTGFYAHYCATCRKSTTRRKPDAA